MKALILSKLYGLAFIIGLGLSSCEQKDERPVPPSDYPKSLAQILNSTEEQNKLINAGMMLYGRPSRALALRAIFLVQHKCSYDNTIAVNIGKSYADYEYNFTITGDTLVSYKAVNSTLSEVSSINRYVQWEDKNNITIFFETTGIFDGVNYKSIRILSGTLSPNNQNLILTNTYDCFIMLETGPDPDDKVADVGTIRVFKSQ